MNIIKLCNADSFRFCNEFVCNYKPYKELLKICIEKKYTGFVIYKKIVYFRNVEFKELITNYIYHKDSVLYILVPEIYKKFLIENNKRVDFYTKSIIQKKHKLDSKKNGYYNIKTLKDKIDSYPENQRNWCKQHHETLYKYLKLLEITDYFYINPYDCRYGKEQPCFVKSRPQDNYMCSVLLPLEKLYLPYHMFPLIKNDIKFNKKKNNVVWRGCNSGYGTSESFRIDLVKKFYNFSEFDIGFSDMRYKKDKYNKNYIKGKISIEEQLKSKFILSVEGNDFATNFSWIMLSNSIPICPIHLIETWFMETKLIPYEHYIPVKYDFSDLVDVYNNALENNDLCQEIIFKKKLFCANFLDPDNEDNIIKDTIRVYFKQTNQ